MDSPLQLVNDAVRALSLVMDLDHGSKLFHGWRVGLLAREIAHGLDGGGDGLYYAGLLHDIGAVGLDEHVVHHARKGFSDPRVRQHGRVGAAILQEFSVFRFCLPFIQDHHERADGRGFPSGKRGSQIAREASILFLADTLEVALRDRPGSSVAQRAQSEIERLRIGAVPAAVADAAAGMLNDNEAWCRRLFEDDQLPAMLDAIAPRPPDLQDVDGQELVVQLLWLFARVLEAKQPAYLDHCARVSFFAHRIAQCLDNEALDPLDALRAGLLHDIGIVGVPAAVLQQTSQEGGETLPWYRQHPHYTQELLSNIRAFAHLAAGSAAHHEHFDGGGFPKGLSGGKIPLLGRVLAYAERYDQLTGGLPGAPSGLTPSEALSVMRQDLGRRLDPRLAYGALNTLEEIGRQTLRLPNSLKSFRRYFQPELDPGFLPGAVATAPIPPAQAAAPPLPKFLSSAEQLHRSLFISCEAVAFANARGMIVEVNPAFERLFGYTRQEVRGYDPGILSARKSGSFISDQIHSMLKQRGTWSGEVTDRHKSGRQISILLTINAIEGQGGRVVGYVAHSADISDRREMEQKLADMALFAELNPDPVLRINARGKIMMRNRACRDIFQQRAEAGASWQDLCTGFKPRQMEAACQSAGVYQHAMTLGDREFQFTYHPIPHSDWIQIYGSDITDRVRAEAALRDKERQLETQNRKLESLNRLMGELMAITSHDLKSPLNGIIGYANLTKEMLGELPAASLRAYLDRIVDAAQELVTFINQLLSEQMIASGEFSIDPRPVRLDAVLTQQIHGLQHLAERRQIRMSCTVLGKSRPFVADAARMGQVFANILTNALKFAPRESEISAIYDGRQPDKLRVQIADQGPGIPESDRKAVFDRYHQVRRRKSDSPRAYGSGLGLYIVQEIVRRHQGRVWVKDNQPAGCRFVIELPCTPPAGQGAE